MKVTQFIERFCLGAVITVQFLAFLVIPLVGSSVFLSPDETANAVSARSFGQFGTMRLEDPILRDRPWLHPRSFVTQGSAMVPVGFLGLSAIVGSLWRFCGDWILVLFTPLLVLSVVYPLWKWSKRFGPSAQTATVIIWLSYPGVILYANRGMFPNLANVCFMVWSVFALGQVRETKRRALWLIGSGICFGLAAIIRPIELFWMLPWVILAATSWGKRMPSWREMRWDVLFWVIGVLPCMLLLLFINWKTYGSPFTVGYWLRDPVLNQAVGTVSPSSLWPFGLHPRAVWFNIRSYALGYLGPWFAICLAGIVIAWKQRTYRPILLGGLWTFGVLALMYGEAIYQDHVGVNIISIGNSYVRYLLPLVPLIAMASAVCMDSFIRYAPRWGRVAGIAIVVAFLGVGNWMALTRDQEGALLSSVEVAHYQTIRQMTQGVFGQNAIILSERSDKIFFPSFRATSPLPSMANIRDLVLKAPTTVALFSSVLDSAHVVPWTEAGLVLRPVFQTQQQMMYVITASSSQP